MTDDLNPIETQEWLESLEALCEEEGKERAAFILKALHHHASYLSLPSVGQISTPYCNSIPVDEEEKIPQEDGVAHRASALIRWNAAMMVLRAGKKAPELGGHIATYASAATIYDIAFEYFFHANDLVYFQGHASPGIYARAFLEGRLTEKHLAYFRQEIASEEFGLSSYPHPWLMPDFWQFATVSMGLGPLQAIYQAHFLKYLHNRKLVETEGRKVFVYCGDGEMDEPESLGAITLAGRENLDNLIFVINCNLQRLDGPVRGNGKIIQELEAVFRGAGWHVIKVIWDRQWDALLAQDEKGLLRKRMEECVDGEYQSFYFKDGAYFREHFFGKYPELLEMVAHLSDDELKQLQRGGHDRQKVYAAYAQAVKHKGQPVLILTKTVKGYGMGTAGEGRNITHQQKKMDVDQLKAFRDRFNLNIPDEKVAEFAFHHPGENSEEVAYLKQRREALGGAVPSRKINLEKLAVPQLSAFSALLESSGEREISTTMAFVRILTTLVKDKNIGPRIVPIVADESRTFGMEGLFRQIGIYSPKGQLYEPEDAGQVMSYREEVNGQILQEGISEPGAMSAWIAAGTSYANNEFAMIPFYIYYSMFGFQRIGDLAWAAADMQAKGFLLGATAGRTTLAGEGLQHQDGHSHLLSSTIPNCVSYDPTFAYEVAVIIQDGLRRMYVENENIYYYITLMNENYHQPAMPKDAESGILKGMYVLEKKPNARAQLLGSGTILREVMQAAEWLAKEYQIECDIWSVTSFNELRREALIVERDNHFAPEKNQLSYVARCLNETKGPVIAATDYMRIVADQIRPFINKHYVVLGTDGFGRSDTRAELRKFFEVDHRYIAYATLKALYDEKEIKIEVLKEAMKKLQLDLNKTNPIYC